MTRGTLIPDPALIEDVRRMISSEFPRVGELDAEEFASEAYCALLEIARSGVEIKNPAATIRQIARRDLLDDRKDRSQVYRATPLAPESVEFHELADLEPEMLSGLEEASTGARLSAIVATLTKRQQAVFKCRFALGMSAAETATTCKLGRSTVKREWSAALEAALEALAGFEGEIFGRAQLKAVHAYVFRFGELADEDPSRRLVEDDPATYQLMVEMRASMRQQAGAVDLKATLAGVGLLGGGFSMAALAGLIRGKLSGAGASQGAGAGTAASAGGGGGGLLAAGTGSKIAAGCAALLCAGGGAAAIKASSEHDKPASDRAAAERPAAGPPAPPPAAMSSPIDPQPQAVSSSLGDREGNDGGRPDHRSNGSNPSGPDRNPTPASATEDAAAEEFDPLAAPSAPAPAPSTTPAPSSSGGSSSSGSGTTGSISGNEFGP